MADTAVSAFAALTAAGIASGDKFPVIDVSAVGAAKNKTLVKSEMDLLFQPTNTKLTTISALASAAGVLTNNGAGVFSYTDMGVGGNGAPDAGLLARFDGSGHLTSVGFAIRDSSAAFDVVLAATSTTALDADRTLTLDLNNTAQTLKFTAAGTYSFPVVGGAVTLAHLGANTFTAAQVIDGSADAVQLTIQGHSTQTSNILLIEKSDGTDLFRFTNTGEMIMGSGGFEGLLSGANNGIIKIGRRDTGAYYAALGHSSRGGVGVSSNGGFFWSDSTDPTNGLASGAANLRLWMDAANVLAQSNTTNAQTFRVYGTTNGDGSVGSNYVRLSLAASSTVVTLAAETAGTGADNIPINITTAGTGLTDFTNQSASTDAAVVSTHTARMKFGGIEYKVLLATP